VSAESGNEGEKGKKREPLIEVKDIYVYFYTYAGVVKAIEDVTFTIYKGETLCLVGETGCGKTVVSRTLTNIVPPPGRIVKGQILYHRNHDVIDILKLPEDKLREIRGKEIAYIIQDPSAALDPLYVVGYQVTETMIDHGTVSNWKEGFKRALNLFREVMIPDPQNRIKAYPHEMSGGMRQRVVISIGLSNEPRLLIADEPTSYLDVTVQAQVLDLIRELKRKKGLTLLLITHDMGVVAEMCERVIVLYAGNIVEVAPVDEIFKRPKHPYTVGLLRAVPNPMTEIEKLESIPGTVPNLIYPPPGCRFHPRCPHATDICRKKKPPLVRVGPGHYVRCWLYAKEKEGEGEGESESEGR